MGSTASRIEAGAGGGCGGCAWRREVVVKGTEDCGGENRKINTVQVVEMEGVKNTNKERKIDEREDELIWSPGSPSFRDYLFLGSFDSNEGKSIQDGGARAYEDQSTADKPEEAVHHRKVNPWAIPAKSRVNIIKYGRMLDGRKYLHCTKNKP